MREVKRQCRTLRISPEHNTGVRIADDSPLLGWLPRFAAQVMNKMRIGKDGKTSEMRRTGRRWRLPMAQFGEKVWFRKVGQDGVNSFASRMTQGIIVGHHDRTGAVLCITKNGALIPVHPVHCILVHFSTFSCEMQDVVWSDQTLLDLGDSCPWDSRL